MELKISRIGAFTTTWHLIVASMENDFILEPTLNRYSQTCSLRATVLVPYYSFGVYQEQPKTGALRPESPKQRSETKAVRDHQITNTSDVSFVDAESGFCLVCTADCNLKLWKQCTQLYSSFPHAYCLLTRTSIAVCQSIHYKWYRHRNEMSEGDTDTI